MSDSTSYAMAGISFDIPTPKPHLNDGAWTPIARCTKCPTQIQLDPKLPPDKVPTTCPKCRSVGALKAGELFVPAVGFLLLWRCAAEELSAAQDRIQTLEEQVSTLQDTAEALLADVADLRADVADNPL